MTATLIAIGNSGASVVNPVPIPHGTDGAPLGPHGNGNDGVAEWFICKKPAQPGAPGNHGDTGPAGRNGGNGVSVFGLRLHCDEFIGSSITLINQGGDGGDGGHGGRGGNGSDGGNSGTQPKYCKGVIRGGVGGNGARGGRAGSGGDAGSAGDVKVVVGPALKEPPVSVTSKAGTPGRQGDAGDGGAPGNGGRNSDGSMADDGISQGGGPLGKGGEPGWGGSFAMNTDSSASPRSLYISIVPRGHG